MSYFSVAFIWTFMSACIQVQKYGWDIPRLIVCIVLNFIFWPIAVGVAAAKLIK